MRGAAALLAQQSCDLIYVRLHVFEFNECMVLYSCRVFQSHARQYTHNVQPLEVFALFCELQNACHGGCRRGFAEYPLIAGQSDVCIDDLGIGDRIDIAARFVAGVNCADPSLRGCRSGWRSQLSAVLRWVRP